jgi:hypothetical protein
MQIRTAIARRHKQSARKPGEVLDQAEAFIKALAKSNRIAADEVAELNGKIRHARLMDKAGAR